MLREFIEAIGRDKLMEACRVTIATTYNWERNGKIPRKYHALIEPVARNTGRFMAWKKIAGGKK